MSIIPADRLPDHILSSGLELLAGLLAPSPTDSGTAFLAAYLASPPSATSVSNMPYGQRPAPSATISSLGGTSCVPGGSALRAPAPYYSAFTGSRFGCISSPQRASPSASIFDLGGGSCVPGGSARRAPAPHDTPFTGPRRPDPDGDISAGLLLPHQARRFGSPASSSRGTSSVPSFWHHHRGPSFSSSPYPRHHGGSSAPSSLSSRHHGGSSFSSSSKAGSSYQPPVWGGSASLASPPSVPCEVQVASSLVATPLTNVSVLPLTVSSHPSLLGSSRDVSRGAASPPPAPTGSHSTVSTAPNSSVAAVPVSASLPAPVGPTPLPVD